MSRSIEDGSPHCSVCNERLDHHWRGRPCLNDPGFYTLDDGVLPPRTCVRCRYPLGQQNPHDTCDSCRHIANR
jgi:hypothetical protein